jgi:transcriptional regulator with XRE-family HTH domain
MPINCFEVGVGLFAARARRVGADSSHFGEQEPKKQLGNDLLFQGFIREGHCVMRRSKMFAEKTRMSSEEDIGKRIRDRRESQNITQAQLAKLVGLSSAAIWNWETKGRVPRPQVLEKVAAALKVSTGYLAEGMQPPNASVPLEASHNVPAGPNERKAASPQDAASTVAEELERTREKIADLTGFDPAQIKLTLTVHY